MILKKAVFFDVDGTLAESFQLGFQSSLVVLKSNGLQLISEADYTEGTKFTTLRRMAWHATGDPDHAIGQKLSDEFEELSLKLVSPETTPVYEGIRDLLQKLHAKEIVLAALSNASGAYVQSVLQVNDIAHLFRMTLGADEVESGKPSPVGLLQLCSSLSVNVDNCIYVGDSPTDGQAATAAGMPGIGVAWGTRSAIEIRDHFSHVVHTVEELEKLIQHLISDDTQ